MKMCRELDVYVHVFMSSVLIEGEVSFTLLLLYPREITPRNPLDRRLGGPQSSLDDMEKRTLLNILGLKLHPSVVKPLGSLHTD
jgi:hypothetical protein